MNKASLICSVSLLSTVAVSCAGKQKSPKLPNIIIILADDMGYGDVSALNPESKINTPNIDEISHKGVTFTDAHAGSALSTPSRYGILTGRYCWRSPMKSGVLTGYSKALIAPDRLTVAGMLQQQGYHTACIGKWHLGWEWANVKAGKDSVDYSRPITDGPTTRGFDYFYGISASLDMPPYVYVENDKPTALPNRNTEGNNIPVGEKGYNGAMWRNGPTGSDFDHADCLSNFTRKAVQYIDQNAKSDKPFFLYFPMPAPHTPILPAKEFQGKSGLNPYGDYVMMVDHMVGEIAQALQKNNIADNTLLIFTTDNGCAPWADITYMEKHGHYPSYVFRGYKSDLFDGGHRIPCVMQWTGRLKPQVVDKTICLTDFMASFAELTGYKLADNEAEDSFSLFPALFDGNPNELLRTDVIHQSGEGYLSIRKGQWKLLMTPGSGGWAYPQVGKETAGLPPIQLYDMTVDEGEKTNVQAQHPEVVAELKALLTKYIEEGRSTPGAVQPHEGKFPWKQLNWME
jgi:arylsulfatase A-like enzyme